MRTNEERIAAMHTRAAELNKLKSSTKIQLLQVLSIAACFAVVILIAAAMPGTVGNLESMPVSGSMSASIFGGNSALAYIFIAVIAFLFGAAVTVFCFRLKKWQDDKSKEDKK